MDENKRVFRVQITEEQDYMMKYIKQIINAKSGDSVDTDTLINLFSDFFIIGAKTLMHNAPEGREDEIASDLVDYMMHLRNPNENH